MNQPLKELVKQMGWEEMEADLHRKTKYGCITTHAIEKFAKLVVQECVDVASNSVNNDEPYEAWYLIEKHFGMGK